MISDDIYIPTGAEDIRPKLFRPIADIHTAISNTFMASFSDETVSNSMNIADLYYIHSPLLNTRVRIRKQLNPPVFYLYLFAHIYDTLV